MLIDVLTRVAADTGYNPVQRRSALLLLLNQAAKEMHKKLEATKMYREVTLVVSPDSVVSIPSFVGELKGMRMHTNEIPFDLQSIGQPRYVSTTLQHKFKNWRDLGESAIHTIPAGFGQITFEATGVETVPIDILISGNTNFAAKEEETVTIDSTTKLTTKLFGIQIDTIACVTPNRSFDVVVKDLNGTEIATLYNTSSKARYKIVDVSQLFWTLDTSAGETLIDVLYKVPATNLFKDSDSFYAGDDYDEAWYQYCMHLYLKPLQGRMQEAMAYLAACLDVLKSAKDSGEGGQVKQIQFGRNKFYGLFRRWRYMPGSVSNVDNNTVR
jgi:hypothetical protein